MFFLKSLLLFGLLSFGVFAGENKVVGIVLNKWDKEDIEKNNYSSFSKNEFYSNGARYSDAINELCDGVSVIFLKPDIESVQTYASILDGLLIPGNTPDINPKLYDEKPITNLIIEKYRSEFEVALIRELFKKRKPILGICAGHQVINVAFDGTLYQDIPTQKQDGKINHNPFSNGSVTVHEVEVSKDAQHLFGGNVNRYAVNSVHHQGIKDIAKGFSVIAKTDDGLVEGIQMKSYPFLVGVQWHPEFQLSKYDQNLLKTFCAAVNGQEVKSKEGNGIKAKLLNK